MEVGLVPVFSSVLERDAHIGDIGSCVLRPGDMHHYHPRITSLLAVWDEIVQSRCMRFDPLVFEQQALIDTYRPSHYSFMRQETVISYADTITRAIRRVIADVDLISLEDRAELRHRHAAALDYGRNVHPRFFPSAAIAVTA